MGHAYKNLLLVKLLQKKTLSKTLNITDTIYGTSYISHEILEANNLEYLKNRFVTVTPFQHIKKVHVYFIVLF